MVNKSDVVIELFNALYHISSRKTTEGYAYSLMKLIKEEFEENYPFFSSFDFTDIRFIEEEKFVEFTRNIENIPSHELYPALKDYIEKLNESLGKNAGPFFYKEISSRISEESQNAMNAEGVDFIIMQLQYELELLEKRIYQNKNKH
jgi:hypothetical protein